MSIPQFLKCGEINLIKRDFANLLLSPEATDLVFQITTPVAPVYDPVFGITDSISGSIVSVISGAGCRGIQHIVTPREQHILDWGVIEVGDCLLYLSTGLNLTLSGGQSLEIIDPAGVHWIPAPPNVKGFEAYVRTRLANGQVGQVLAVKLKK